MKLPTVQLAQLSRYFIPLRLSKGLENINEVLIWLQQNDSEHHFLRLVNKKQCFWKSAVTGSHKQH
jgi:hypothetical protein